ncbi:MAG: tRNA(Ile2)-agmatinylcytidine synthase [Thermoproteota archaeon]|nr:tRNA(Ile2)-agmatinylcytidine synthase [Thermoproteota archaeon]
MTNQTSTTNEPNRIPLHIGIDDTDSTRQGCTTYIAALLTQKLIQLGADFFDYPNLIRLNPNIPWKTRGNAALSLRVNINQNALRKAIEETLRIVERESDLSHPRTDPGIVFYQGKPVPQDIKTFARRTIQDVVKKSEALKLIKHYSAEAYGFNSGRGIIGALAAIGETLEGDHTYEFIAYRIPANIGSPRRVDDKSVLQMDVKMKGQTYNNTDPDKKRVLITPRGKDPVLLGIRGEDPQAVKIAYSMIKVNEKIERWIVFRTNQATDAHLRKIESIKEIRPYRPVIAVGSLVQEPHMIPGRHVIFTIQDNTAKIDCAAYEPTGKFRNIIRQLSIGDQIEVYGGVRPPSIRNLITINLEKIKIISLTTKTTLINPHCRVCGGRMESMGKGQGLRCKKCNNREDNAKKTATQVPRKISEGLYIPPPRAHRHLTKPFCRYGIEKTLHTSTIPRDFEGLGNPHFTT